MLIVQGAQLLNSVKGLNCEEYKKMILKKSDKIITNIKLAWKELSPSARKLANIIALINNQEFSKNFLESIIPSELEIDDAIYQLTKFGLIQNVNTNTESTIFEMHDIMAANITRLNQSNNKQYIEDILLRIVSSMPKGIIEGFLYRRQQIIQKNIEVIQRNAEKFKANLQNVMSLKLNLFSDYTNNYDFYKSSQMVDWFYNQDQELLFRVMSKNDEAIKIYADYLCLIGAYYRNKYMDYRKGLDLHLKAISLLEGIEGEDTLLKCYGYYNIASQFSYLGQEENALKYINLVEKMLKNGNISEQYKFLQNVVKSHLFATKGDSKKALKEINLALKDLFAIEVNPQSILLTQIYLTRSSVLSDLKQYAEASEQIETLYQIHKLLPYGENSNVMGRIYLQKARAAFGLELKVQSIRYVDKAIEIFTLEENTELSNSDISINPELAEAYTLKGDLEASSGNIVPALDYYRRTQVIYFYLYKKDSKNIAKVSELYLRGAKAACKNKDSYLYKSFGEPQIEGFGLEHHNTVQMLKYCKKHGMDLWVEGS